VYLCQVIVTQWISNIFTGCSFSKQWNHTKIGIFLFSKTCHIPLSSTKTCFPKVQIKKSLRSMSWYEKFVL